MKRINNCKDLFCDIRQSNRDYFEKIRSNGGIDLFLRALIAQILWFAFFYNIGMMLIPVKDFFLSNTIFLVIISFSLLLRGVIGDRIPYWFNGYVKGDFFYKLSINFLNKWIFALILLTIGQTFLISNLDNFKLYGRKK